MAREIVRRARAGESRAMSQALRECGLGFTGPAVCSTFMQAVDMEDDQTLDCFYHAELRGPHGYAQSRVSPSSKQLPGWSKIVT